jgi:hypothetical protein
MDWVETAPTPERTKGQIAPTAKAQVATATAEAPVPGSWAAMDQVMRAETLPRCAAPRGAAVCAGTDKEHAMAPTIRTSRARRRRRDLGRLGSGAAGLGIAPAAAREWAAWPDRAVERVRAGGAAGGTPERFAASIRGRTERRVPVIRAAGIEAE